MTEPTRSRGHTDATCATNWPGDLALSMLNTSMGTSGAILDSASGAAVHDAGVPGGVPPAGGRGGAEVGKGRRGGGPAKIPCQRGDGKGEG